MNQIEPYNINTVLNTQTPVPAYIRQEWQQYLVGDTDPKMYSVTQKHQLSIAEYFYSLEQQDRTLYHMSITYKPFSDRVYAEKDVNTFLKTFYIKRFLPYIMGTRNYHTNRMKSIQPITYCFVDEGETKAVKTYNTYTFPTRLHHHAILAVDDYSKTNMDRLVGENTIANGYFTPKIMTSDIKQCEAQRVLYASKMLWKYPDFMSFPDTFKRHRNKVSH